MPLNYYSLVRALKCVSWTLTFCPCSWRGVGIDEKNELEAPLVGEICPGEMQEKHGDVPYGIYVLGAMGSHGIYCYVPSAPF